MITPGLHPLCQLLSIYKFEILHHSILGNSDKRRDFDPTVSWEPFTLFLAFMLMLAKNPFNIIHKHMIIITWKWVTS